MKDMDGLKVLDVLKKTNPWLGSEVVPSSKLEPFKRRELELLKSSLSELDLMTLIIGARRVGKSVLMYQMIDYLLQKGVLPNRILFIQGDHTLLREYAEGGSMIRSILELYQKYILNESLDQLSEPIYVFIDEAQAIGHWEDEIKTNIDHKYKVKFVVTGSSSFELRRGAENPLTGRVKIQPISPFSFADYLRYNVDGKSESGFKKKLERLSSVFVSSLSKGDIEEALIFAKEAALFLKKYKAEDLLLEYLYYGGFPRVVAKDKDDFSRYLRDLLTSTISKDILSNVEIRDPQAFERLLVNISLMVGNITKYKKFADILGLDERSVVKHINYYVETHWIHISSGFEFSNKIQNVASAKKFYLLDTGVINSLIFKDFEDVESDATHIGHLLENAIHNHLLVKKQEAGGIFQNSINYWVEAQTDKEIDFIYEIPGGVIPIEVKKKVSYDESDLEAVSYFIQKRGSAKFGVVTTQDTLEIRGKILLVPNHILLALL